MKLEQNGKNILFSVTEIPDLFFTEYLSNLKGDHLKVYLYLLFIAKYNKDIKLNDLSKSIGVPFETMKEAFTNLEQMGLITKKLNSGYIVNDLQELELYKIYKPKITLSPEDRERKQKNSYRIQAIENINNSCFSGLMAPDWELNIEMWFKKYSFDEQVMIALFSYCKENGKLYKNYVQAVAEAWAKNNIKTYADLEAYEQKQEKMHNIQKYIAKKLGFNRELSQYEQSYIEKWVVDFGYPMEVIEIALKKTTSKANPNFDYLDKLLSDWKERNLKTPDEVNQFLQEMKQKQKDIKNLEKKASYNSYEQRQYKDFDSLYFNAEKK